MVRGARLLVLSTLVSSALPPAASAADKKIELNAAPESPKTPTQLTAEGHYKRGRELYQLGRYREAIAQLEAALRLDPSGAELLYNLGLVHEKLGEADEAIDAYRRYVKALGPDADPEELRKMEGVITRLAGAKAELKAREAKRVEHRWTPLSGSLAVVSIASFVTTAVLGVMAVRHDGQARDFVLGVGGSVGERDELIAKSKREAIAADVLGAVALLSGGAALGLYLTSHYPRRDNPRDVVAVPRSARVSWRAAAAGGILQFEVPF